MKMAVVGCEASGKTVFMCALADYYGRDAANNPLRLKLTPENAAANCFERFQFRQMRCLRQWPPATSPDHAVEMKWAFRHAGQPVCGVEMLEFGGETFRSAFGGDGINLPKDESVKELTKYLNETDFFVVLVSIKSLIANPTSISEDAVSRESEGLWVTRGIIDYIRKHRPNAGVVIGLTQADQYRRQLTEAGGPERFFVSRWPTVAAAAEGIPVVDVASVSQIDVFGNPEDGYNTRGILPVMRVFAKHCFGDENALENGAVPRVVAKRNFNRKILGVVGAIIAALGLAAASATIAFNSAKKQSLPDPEIFADSAFMTERTVTNTVEKVRVVEKIVQQPVTNTIERIVEVPVTNTIEMVIEKQIEIPVTNDVETIVEMMVEVPVTNTVEKIVESIVEMRVEVPVTNTVEKIVETVIEVPVTNTIEKIVETVVEKRVEVPVTNTIEKIIETFVEVPVTNTVEKIVEVPVTNTVEKVIENIVEVPVTNTVEKIVEKVVEKRVEVPVTNTVEKIVEKVVEKAVAKPMTDAAPKTIQRVVVTNTVKKTAAPTATPAATTATTAPAPVQNAATADTQVPPGYRIWTDYNGRKIIARWTGVAVDESGITIVTRYNRRLDAVLWKFSEEDQAYIKAEIKRHRDLDEVMIDGKWIRNPMLKNK